jgi:alkyl hydroperoxide reductase subunit F
MSLDQEIKSQLAQYLELLEGDVVLKVSAGSDEASEEMTQLVNGRSNEVIQNP